MRARSLGLVLLLAGVLFVAHPYPHVAWFDTPLVAHAFNTRGWIGGMAWFQDYHSFRRPVRALEWNLMAHAFGEHPAAYHAVNVVAVSASAVLLGHLLGFGAAALWLVSYVTVYPILHFPLALNFALGLGGFALIMRGEGPSAARASPKGPTILGVVLIVMATQGHEVFLVFALLPYLYSRLVRPLPQGGTWGAFAAIPLWWLTKGTSSGWNAIYDSPVLEHVGRVTFSILSLGGAPEMLRSVGWPAPYLRVREVAVTWQGALIIASLVVPVVLALTIALWRPWSGRVRFRVAWAGLASLPLFLPVGTPESYHLIGAVGPMAAICESGWRRARWLVLLVPLVLLPHLVARWQLFYRDLPLASMVVKNVRSAYPAGSVIDFMPLLVGGHYAYWPALPERYCLRKSTWVLSLEDVAWPDHPAMTRVLAHRTAGSAPVCR